MSTNLIDRWLHHYDANQAQSITLEATILPDDGFVFCGPWEPIGCAVDPNWQLRGVIFPMFVTLWRRPMIKEK